MGGRETQETRPDLNESIVVYGFGSFFSGKDKPRDIDLLLVHRSTDMKSCKFAIDCKERLRSAIPLADIVLLSAAEAESLNFIERAKAVRLGNLSFESMDADVEVLAGQLLSR
jgi:hypothetical protein